jgi:hypothetical protein
MISRVGFTQADYQRFISRGMVARKAASDACEKEIGHGGLHEQIMEECRRRGWITLHGSTAHPTRRNEGEPDFIVIADGGRIFLIECKSKTGKLSIEQQQFAAHAAKLGTKVHLVRSLREFVELL